MTSVQVSRTTILSPVISVNTVSGEASAYFNKSQLTNSFCPFNRVNSIMAILASNQLIGE
jgi:hypothetical protein